MKGLKFGDNVAIIGGKRVPYSLLGALAAILGAFLIWKQFQGGGGLALGQQSPDLSGLTDLTSASGGGGGGGGVDLGSSVDPLLNASSPVTAPVYALSYPAPVYGPAYGMDSGSSAVAVYSTTPAPVPVIDSIAQPTLITQAASSLTNYAAALSPTRVSQSLAVIQSTAQAIRTPAPAPAAPAPAPAPDYGFIP